MCALCTPPTEKCPKMESRARRRLTRLHRRQAVVRAAEGVGRWATSPPRTCAPETPVVLYRMPMLGTHEEGAERSCSWTHLDSCPTPSRLPSPATSTPHTMPSATPGGATYFSPLQRSPQTQYAYKLPSRRYPPPCSCVFIATSLLSPVSLLHSKRPSSWRSILRCTNGSLACLPLSALSFSVTIWVCSSVPGKSRLPAKSSQVLSLKSLLVPHSSPRWVTQRQTKRKSSIAPTA